MFFELFGINDVRTKEAYNSICHSSCQEVKAPFANALAYVHNQKETSDQNELIFNLDDGTCDVSIATIDNEIFEVKSAAGDTHLSVVKILITNG
ncbi:unnamed protein product [Larinioides sclopetarius]|uniref:Uncharacterized protein n=1 Tax=Larinioides sclopetarius TaxID=280406 RepID=A0AAV2BK32_9ARAC